MEKTIRTNTYSLLTYKLENISIYTKNYPIQIHLSTCCEQKEMKYIVTQQQIR